MLNKGWIILKGWLQIAEFLISVILVCLMGSLVIIGFLLVVFIVGTKQSVGRILTKGGVSVCSSMQGVKDFLHKLGKSLT